MAVRWAASAAMAGLVERSEGKLGRGLAGGGWKGGGVRRGDYPSAVPPLGPPRALSSETALSMGSVGRAVMITRAPLVTRPYGEGYQ